MGTRTDGILFYGYDLGGDEGGWEIEQVNEYDEPHLPWYDPEADEADFVEAKVITVRRGHVKVIDWAALERERVEHGWDTKLAAALSALGMTPKQAGPRWLLVSDWG